MGGKERTEHPRVTPPFSRRKIYCFCLLLLSLCFQFDMGIPASEKPLSFSPKKTPFELKIRDFTIPNDAFAFFALPSERIELEVIPDAKGSGFQMECAAGHLEPAGKMKWLWTAPSLVGRYYMRVKKENSEDAIALAGFVMILFTS